MFSKGEDWKGDESVRVIFWHVAQQESVWLRPLGYLAEGDGEGECGARACLTFVVWFQLGEFRRFSVGEISERARGNALGAFAGDDMVLFLERRRGCTWEEEGCCVRSEVEWRAK